VGWVVATIATILILTALHTIISISLGVRLQHEMRVYPCARRCDAGREAERECSIYSSRLDPSRPSTPKPDANSLAGWGVDQYSR